MYVIRSRGSHGPYNASMLKEGTDADSRGIKRKQEWWTVTLADEEGKPLVGAVDHKDEETGWVFVRTLQPAKSYWLLASATNQTR